MRVQDALMEGVNDAYMDGSLPAETVWQIQCALKRAGLLVVPQDPTIKMLLALEVELDPQALQTLRTVQCDMWRRMVAAWTTEDRN